VPEIDISDDSLTRFVVKHYKFDRSTKHFNHLELIALDNKKEFDKKISELGKSLQILQNANEVSSKEHIYGVIYQPGHFAQTNQMHIVKKMIRHGVNPNAYFSQNRTPGFSQYKVLGSISHHSVNKFPFGKSLRNIIHRLFKN
jgi:hypothetical protein